MRDLFEKIYKDKGPLGKWASQAEGYFVFPKLEGQISNRMKFQGKDVITWSINDYLGLANHPEVRKVDAEASNDYGSAYPMGARMMSGHTALHEQLQQELAAFVNKEAAYVLNFGYQGIMSTVDALVMEWHHKNFNKTKIQKFKWVMDYLSENFKVVESNLDLNKKTWYAYIWCCK